MGTRYNDPWYNKFDWSDLREEIQALLAPPARGGDWVRPQAPPPRLEVPLPDLTQEEVDAEIVRRAETEKWALECWLRSALTRRRVLAAELEREREEKTLREIIRHSNAMELMAVRQIQNRLLLEREREKLRRARRSRTLPPPWEHQAHPEPAPKPPRRPRKPRKPRTLKPANRLAQLAAQLSQIQEAQANKEQS